MIVTPALTTVFEAQNESRLRRWLGKCYLCGGKLVRLSARGGLIFEAHCMRIFENKPSTQSGPCLMLKWGGGAYFQEDTVCVSAFHVL